MTLMTGGGFSMSFGNVIFLYYLDDDMDDMLIWFSLYGQLFLLYNRHSLTSPRDNTDTITNMLVCFGLTAIVL